MTRTATTGTRSTGWAARACGPRAPARLSCTARGCGAAGAEPRDELTPQERQIAELARDGLSNPEIGARLFLSPRTVEWHLRNVFTKLGVQSRRELHRVLDAASGP